MDGNLTLKIDDRTVEYVRSFKVLGSCSQRQNYRGAQERKILPEQGKACQPAAG